MPMQYQNTLVPVGNGEPPEDLISFVAGNCGRWQICVALVAFTSELLHVLNLYSKLNTAPQDLNFTCENGNGTQCFDANGSKCENFIFYKQHKLVTYTEKYSLVCDKHETIVWTENCFRIGLIISYFIVGWTADRCGRKIAAMTYIPLHCISGSLILMKSSYEMLLFFHVVHGIFSTSLNLLPQVSLCDAVGSKWRTFALGLISYPMPIGWLLTLYFATVFSDVTEIIGGVSLLPILILVPLLYFRDSPSYFLTNSDFERAEEDLRKIASFNKCPIPRNIKIRPVEVIDKKCLQQSYRNFWKYHTTRIPFLALWCLWFVEGISYDILINHVNSEKTDTNELMIFGVCSLLGCIFGIILCHLIPHKVVICTFSLLKNFSIFVVILLITAPVLSRRTNSSVIFGFKMVSFCVYGICSTSLENLTPRMFPTGFRSQGIGVCLSLFHTGCFISNITFSLGRQSVALWMISSAFLVIFIPAFETISCYWLWKVHKRELPDYIEDCINFKTFYKPQRYLCIQEHSLQLNPHEEIEVKSMLLTSRDQITK